MQWRLGAGVTRPCEKRRRGQAAVDCVQRRRRRWLPAYLRLSIHPSIHVYLTFLRPSLPICLVAAPAPQRRSLGAALCFRTCTGRRLWLRRIALARGGGCGVSSVQKQAAAATTCAGGSQDSPDDSSVCKEVNLFSVGSGRTIFSRPLSILEQ